MKRIILLAAAFALFGCGRADVELVDGRKFECLELQMAKAVIHCRTESGTETFTGGMVTRITYR